MKIDGAEEDGNYSRVNYLTPAIIFQIIMQTRERISSDKVRCEVDSVVPNVETMIKLEISVALDIGAIPIVELAITSSNASSTRNPSAGEIDQLQRVFLGETHGLGMTSSISLNSKTNSD